jgi:hypothetical protein
MYLEIFSFDCAGTKLEPQEWRNGALIQKVGDSFYKLVWGKQFGFGAQMAVAEWSTSAILFLSGRLETRATHAIACQDKPQTATNPAVVVTSMHADPGVRTSPFSPNATGKSHAATDPGTHQPIHSILLALLKLPSSGTLLSWF